MSINTDKGNQRYLKIIQPLSEEIEKIASHSKNPEQAKCLMEKAAFYKTYVYQVAKEVGAGSIVPLSFESLIEKINMIFDGDLRVESIGGMDINDGTDVKTALIQSVFTTDPNANLSDYSCVSGIKNKQNGIRAVIINDRDENNVTFEFVVIPVSKILINPNLKNKPENRIDSISFRFDSETNKISLFSDYWSCRCSFYEFCMMPEPEFESNFQKNEAIRRQKIRNIVNQRFENIKNILIENRFSSLYSLFGTVLNENDYKNEVELTAFTPEQKNELREISAQNLKNRSEYLWGIKYNTILNSFIDGNFKTKRELLTHVLGDSKKADNCGWFQKAENGKYPFNKLQRLTIQNLLNRNKNIILEQERTEIFNQLLNIAYNNKECTTKTSVLKIYFGDDKKAINSNLLSPSESKLSEVQLDVISQLINSNKQVTV